MRFAPEQFDPASLREPAIPSRSRHDGVWRSLKTPESATNGSMIAIAVESAILRQASTVGASIMRAFPN
jgi:hypothetical protein